MNLMNAHIPTCRVLLYALVILGALLVHALSFGQDMSKALPNEAEVFYFPPEVADPWNIIHDSATPPSELIDNKWARRGVIRNKKHLAQLVPNSSCKPVDRDYIDSRFVVLLKYDAHVDTLALTDAQVAPIQYNSRFFESSEYYIAVLNILKKYDWKLRFYANMHFYDGKYHYELHENCLQKFICKEFLSAWFRDYARMMKKEDPNFEDYNKGVLYH